MCGIAGSVNTESGARADAATIRSMCDCIIHRGPDDEGIYVKEGVGLGMRRLSIIDLTSGRQPIHNEDRTVWVVFNGEIYNFLQLRPELEKRGHRFYTNTDTEVIVHLYEEYGTDCMKKLRGMFAIALYDEKRKLLLLARDRLGKKPLHYALHKGNLYFGSEIKSLLAAAPELGDVDREGLLHFFYFGFISDPHTAFKAIRKLPPGHLLEFTNGRIKIRQYWELPEFGTLDPSSQEECLEDLESRLTEAVRIRLISDVPLGGLLSGGVDSSTVVALMAKSTSVPVKTFSIGFKHQDFNEAGYARVVAERFQTEHHEMIVEPNFGETLEKLSGLLEEPFADSSIIPTYFVSRLARQHVTVALSGDGGDELFAGYDRYVVNLARQWGDHIPRWMGNFYRNRIFPLLPMGFLGRKFSYNIVLSSRDRYIDGMSFLPFDARERSFFSKEFFDWACRQVSPAELFRSYFDHAPANDLLSRLQFLDAKTYLAADILTKVDRMSMATSLEVRCPILDHVFVEWVTSLAPRWKLRMGQRKYALKKVAERIGVPHQVLYRPKQGFGIPLVHWFRQELKSGLLQILLEPRTLQRGYFDPKAVHDVVQEHLSCRRDRSGHLWALLIFELWHRNYLEALLGHSSPRAFLPDLAISSEERTTTTRLADPLKAH